MGDKMAENENKPRRKSNFVTGMLFVAKLMVFTSLLFTTAVMYYVGNVQRGNDLLLTTTLFMILNKIDAMES